MNKNQFQQGDVLIERIDTIPQLASKQEQSKVITLAEGEVTGHAHRIMLKDPTTVDTFVHDAVMYFKSLLPVTLKHEEHKEITLPPGTYKSWIVQERDHLEKLERRVAD